MFLGFQNGVYHPVGQNGSEIEQFEVGWWNEKVQGK